MGFVDQARRTIKYNRSQLKEKSFFKNLGRSKYIRKLSRVDSNRLRKSIQKSNENRNKRKLPRTILVSLILLIVILILFIIFFF